MEDSDFKLFPAETMFNKPATINTQNNIIAGPGPHEYWWHSPGFKQPMEREEQGFPPQGNIGELVRQEAIDQYKGCNHQMLIGGSPNCTTNFIPDFYSTSNTCGANCVLKEPELFGDKDFGLKSDSLVTNIHSLHAYENVRAGAAGQDTNSAYSCYEWIPEQNTRGSSCVLEQPPQYLQVGDWSKLPQYANIVSLGGEQAPVSAPVSAPVGAPVGAPIGQF